MDVHSHEARTSDLPLPQSQTMLLHAFAGSDLISSQNSASPSEASPLPNFLQRQLFQKNLPRLYSFPANHIHRTLKFPSVSGLLLFSSFHSTTIMSTHGSLPILLVHFQEQHQHDSPAIFLGSPPFSSPKMSSPSWTPKQPDTVSPTGNDREQQCNTTCWYLISHQTQRDSSGHRCRFPSDPVLYPIPHSITTTQ